MKARKLIAMLLVVATLMSFAPMAVFAAEGDTYVVDVQYVYEGGPLDGQPVATPWSGSYAHGSADERTITIPTAQGYTAQLATLPANVDATLTDGKLTFSFSELASAKTILVQYVPAAVGMKVEYYQQNAGDDDYTHVATDTISAAKTGDPISDYVSYTDGKIVVQNAEKKYTGFYGLWFDSSDTVAADGNTVVEVYFDRDYYLLSFDLGGGYGVDPQFLRYGQTVAAVGTPVRPGYTFAGWDVAVPTTMPAENTKLTAQWNAVETANYTIVYWGENPNDEGYSYIKSVQTSAAPGTELDGTKVTATYYCGFEAHTHTDCTLTCTIAEHTHSDACCTVEEHEHSTACCDSSMHFLHTCNTNVCGNQTEHTHGDGNCVYSDTAHTHSASCYSCGKTAHTHTSDCSTNSMADTTLWTYVKSDSVTVAADGSTVINVYYDRTYFTMTFKEEGSNGDTLSTIYDKWGADIKTRFETVSKDNTFFWSMSQDGGSPWTCFMDVMPAENRTYYADPQSGSTTLSAYYKTENLAGTAYDTLYTVTFKGSSTITVTKEEYVEIEGFTFNSSKSTAIGSSYNGASFYYDRNSYNLTFMSGSDVLKTESVLYEKVLTEYGSYEPANPPSYLEAGAYVFGGWYQNPECTGDPFDFSQKMPAKNQIVYAKWVPVTHTVTVYLDAAAAEAGTNPLSTQVVDHRAFATAPEGVKNGDYAFVAWFYKDAEGNEKAFDFASMQITKDMVVYGKWKATNPVAYTVKFQLADGTPVADDVNGMALPFTAVTAEAKVGTELDEAYQEGYFPNIASQAITMSADASENVIIFTYTPAEKVPYTVKYLEEGTNNVLKEEKVVSDNTKSVVTETAAYIYGYMADAYQKRLVLTVGEDAENVIIFYYTADTENTMVIVEHVLDDTQLVYDYSETPEKKDTVITESAKTDIDGYVFDYVDIFYLDGTVVAKNVTDSTVSRTLTLEGLHIVFHYIPNEFYVYHQSDKTTDTYALPENANFDVTTVVKSGHIYGGLYTSTEFTTPYTSATLAGAYKNQPVDGMHLKPVAGEIYYLKEVHEDYVSPGIYRVWNDAKTDKPLHKLYLITAVDDLNYLETGVELNWVDGEGKVTATKEYNTNTLTGEVDDTEDNVHSIFAVEFHNQNYAGTTITEYTATDIFGSNIKENSYLYIHNFSEEFLAKKGETINYNAYHVTPDGIRVEGIRTRTLINVDGSDTNLSKAVTVGSSSCSVYEPKTENEAETAAFVPLSLNSTYAIRGDVVYAITKVDGKTTETQITEAGDQTGSITYTEKAGYIFAGWYTNKACTKPADFSDIQSDMTVYPKYVSAKQVTAKTTALGKFMTATVSVPGTDLTQVGVSYTLDGETTNVLCKKSQGLIGGLKKLFGSKTTTYTASWNMKGLTNGDTFTVTTYWVTADGTMVEIETNDFAYSRNRISVQ